MLTAEELRREELRTTREMRGIGAAILAISIWMGVSWAACGAKYIVAPDAIPTATRWAR